MNTTCPREHWEEIERQILLPYAALSAETRGRSRYEEKCRIRTDYQRDRDRIIHSKAFRRLKHKTQVFLDSEEDHFRTRLTHTLEVSQIARTISRALRLNEDLTEAVALAHDLGHTPFGHSGEDALDEVYREYVPGARFRHNEQSLRVVDILERKGQGLNLTWEVRNGILHHAKGREDLRIDTKGPATLEGKVVRISDRIAYINHDIDDAIRAELIAEESLPSTATAVLGVSYSDRIDTMVKDVVAASEGRNGIYISDRMRTAANSMKEFLYERVYTRNPKTAEELDRAKQILKEVFRFYMDNIREIRESQLTEDDGVEDRARSVCDFVAGMTDRYVQQKYAEYVLPLKGEHLLPRRKSMTI